MRVIGQDYNPSMHIYLVLVAGASVLGAYIAWWLALVAVATLFVAGRQIILLIQQCWFCACDAYNAYEYRKYTRRVNRMRMQP